MNLLTLDRLSPQAVVDLAPSFESLPQTDHKDGQYRLRRYSLIELMLEPKAFKELSVDTFMQTDKYNEFQGNVDRRFENLEPDVLHGEGMKEAVYRFRMLNNLPMGTLVDIHQMRVITLYEDTPVSPEGVHRDGYDCIMMLGIARHNVEGGNLLVYQEKDGDHFMSLPLTAGSMVIINDRELWHNAQAIQSQDKSQDGYVDAFIMTAKLDRKINVAL